MSDSSSLHLPQVNATYTLQEAHVEGMGILPRDLFFKASMSGKASLMLSDQATGSWADS